MKIAYNFPFHSCPPVAEFVSGDALAELAVLLESHGFSSAALTDHPAPSEAWRQAGGHDTLDPFVGLAFIAAATSELRLLTYLAVLPYRNPFLVAKTVATLDALSGGRVELGLGTGYLKSEYFALGVDFDERNALFDESIEVMKLAWTGEPVSYQGLHFSARNVTAMPTPAQRPHPPLWLGGNSKLTRRRVAEKAAGWLPMLNPPETAGTRRSAVLESVDDFAVMLADLRAHAERVGRTEPVHVMFCPPDIPLEPDEADLRAHVELAKQLADLGVQWIAVNGRGRSLAEAKAFVERYADEVVGSVTAL
jgi:probable F420-dependent oxidoreductase